MDQQRCQKFDTLDNWALAFRAQPTNNGNFCFEIVFLNFGLTISISKGSNYVAAIA